MFEKSSKHVFVDESGDPYLDLSKDGVSQNFVLTAVIVSEEDLLEISESVSNVIKDHFQNGEMKSSSVGNNSTRRKKILTSLGKISFKHYSQVIHKSEILNESGLSYKRTFVKFINRTMYQRLFQTFSSLHVIADEHGSSEFMSGFSKYIQRKIPNTLFESSSFNFGNSKDYPLIQLSDIIAGTIARVYSGKDSIDILEPIRKNTLIIDEWPPKSPILIENDLRDDFKLDVMVRDEAVKFAEKFIDENFNTNEFHLQAQIAAVRYLLYHFRSVDPQEYIPTHILHHHLSQLGYQMSVRMLRSKVIGVLRDKSVFIVSSPKGIKIPYDVDELRKFAKQVNDMVMPYLRRLGIIYQHYLLKSNGELDIVPEEILIKLNRILNSNI